MVFGFNFVGLRTGIGTVDFLCLREPAYTHIGDLCPVSDKPQYLDLS